MTTPMTKAEVLAVLREVLLSPNSIHHPFAHDYIKDEKGCDKCKRYKRFEQAMGAIAAWNVSPDGDVVPPAAQEVKQDGMSFGVVVAGDWAIPTECGARIVDARMAYGWNQCREEMLERLSQLAQQGGESKDG